MEPSRENNFEAFIRWCSGNPSRREVFKNELDSYYKMDFKKDPAKLKEADDFLSKNFCFVEEYMEVPELRTKLCDLSDRLKEKLPNGEGAKKTNDCLVNHVLNTGDIKDKILSHVTNPGGSVASIVKGSGLKNVAQASKSYNENAKDAKRSWAENELADLRLFCRSEDDLVDYINEHHLKKLMLKTLEILIIKISN